MYLREYELVYIAKPELEEEVYRQVGDRLAEVVEEAGGHKLHIDPWGRKRLAYEIEDFTKGMYFILNFLGEPRVVTEAERFLRYHDQVLRYMTVKLEDRVDVEQRKARAEREEAERAAKRAAEEEAARRAAEEREAIERERAEREAARAAERGAPSADDEDAPAEAEDDSEHSDDEESEA